MKRYLPFFLMFLALSVFAQEGKKAPDFSLDNIDGDPVTLSENTGSGPVVLSFWATWCKPCIEELPHLEKIYAGLKDKGLKIFAISVDGEKTTAKVEPFAKTRGMQIPVLLDPNGDVARAFYAKDVPFTVLLNAAGEIVYTHSGYKLGDELELMDKIIKLIDLK